MLLRLKEQRGLGFLISAVALAQWSGVCGVGQRERIRWTSPAVRVALAAVGGLDAALFLAWLAVASAESVGEDDGEALVATLQPGDIFVGWVAEPMDVERLFEVIPELQAITGWSASWQEAFRASAGFDGSVSGGLRAIEPGAAYLLRLGGDSAVNWNRSSTPEKGLVKQRTGENWVSWLGHRSGRYHWGRITLLHEYVYALQDHLSDGCCYRAPTWMVEGSANWIESEPRTFDR
ncbi:MAG: hypothetical protein OXH38_04205 [Chloroflexi bacterium]|nr:hypothetical protein [Chloroflexota bacterium]